MIESKDLWTLTTEDEKDLLEANNYYQSDVNKMKAYDLILLLKRLYNDNKWSGTQLMERRIRKGSA